MKNILKYNSNTFTHNNKNVPWFHTFSSFLSSLNWNIVSQILLSLVNDALHLVISIKMLNQSCGRGSQATRRRLRRQGRRLHLPQPVAEWRQQMDQGDSEGMYGFQSINKFHYSKVCIRSQPIVTHTSPKTIYRYHLLPFESYFQMALKF